MCGCEICVIIFSMQASLNHYQLDNINVLREQARAYGGRIAHSVVYSTKIYNSYANDVYPNNQHMHLNPRDAILEIQYNPVDGFLVPHLQMCPSTIQYMPKVMYTPRINGTQK